MEVVRGATRDSLNAMYYPSKGIKERENELVDDYVRRFCGDVRKEQASEFRN